MSHAGNWVKKSAGVLEEINRYSKKKVSLAFIMNISIASDFSGAFFCTVAPN